MSFFQQQGDDSNLQYDDAAFLYFIASTLIISVVILTISIVNDFLSMELKDQAKLKKEVIFQEKINNLKAEKRRSLLKRGLLIKLILLIALCIIFLQIYSQSQLAQNKLKGFDPYQILGVPQNSTLRQIKKAYRQLAMKYHPDKNKGNVQAQNKFILISKSYECFTNQEKRTNCFKYGNPDGEGAFRIGIGLPHFFINVEYQYYVLPIVLAVLLIWIPWMMISWNNKTKTLDGNGISVATYNTLFKTLQAEPDRFSFLYILAGYPELYEDQNYGPISTQNKEKLFELIKSIPSAEKPVLDQLNDNQLLILSELFNYSANLSEFTLPDLRQKIQLYIPKTLLLIRMFTSKQAQGAVLYNNPQWIIRFLGIKIVDYYFEFTRNYYNRTLLLPMDNENWIYSLDIQKEEREKMKKEVRENKLGKQLYKTLSSEDKMKVLCNKMTQNKGDRLERQLKTWPLYSLQLKLKVDGKQVTNLSTLDYSYIYFKLSLTNNTQGYSYLHNYPYPKRDKVYIMGIEANQVIFIKEALFEQNEKEYVQRVAYRTSQVGQHCVQVFALHQGLQSLDVITEMNFTVREIPPEQLNKPVEFHYEDLHLQRLYKSFFETMIDLSIDPQEHQLSDSEEERQEEQENEEENELEQPEEALDEQSD